MIKDKYTATWVSHSSIGDYLKCPRSYYLKNVYRDPKTSHKIALMQPALALGSGVHIVLENLSKLPKETRFKERLTQNFTQYWLTFAGKKGGFTSIDEENRYKERGLKMLERIQENPGPLMHPAVKLRQNLPYYWLSADENIILCGKIDWLEYLSQTDSVHVIDFKTGKTDEDDDSLQLLIYFLLVKNCQPRKVSQLSYWYLDRDDDLTRMKLPDGEVALETVLEIAKKIALARKLEHYNCPKKDSCFACKPFELIISGKAEFLGEDEMGRDMYVLK